jgi:ferredoxin-NADP reductase
MHLEFMIKIYKDHAGVTNMLGSLNAGDELILHDVFGAIQYKGPGVFIAGGAGITPFIAIFRELYAGKLLPGNTLYFSNKTRSDVILEQELELMLKERFIRLYTRESDKGIPSERIDRNFLVKNMQDFKQPFYICGPDEFVSNISGYLTGLGANPDTVVFEK